MRYGNNVDAVGLLNSTVLSKKEKTPFRRGPFRSCCRAFDLQKLHLGKQFYTGF